MNYTDLRLQLAAAFEECQKWGYTRSFEEFPDVFSHGDTLDLTAA